MNRKFLIITGLLFFVIGAVFATIQSATSPTGELNEKAYQNLESNIDARMPGILSGNFRTQVQSYCRSERSIDIVQLNFKMADKPMSHNRSETLKKILDNSDVCAGNSQ